MSNADSHIWPGTPRRARLPGACWCALLLCGLGLGPAALADTQDCDWTLASAAGTPSGEARQQTERELREELARKLKQFDDCMAQIGKGSGLQGDGDGGSAGDSAERAASEANLAQAGNPADTEGSAEDANREDREVAARPASPRRGSADPFDPAGTSPAAEPPGSASPPPNTRSAGKPQGAGELPEPALVEDDTARIIREAAEKETDPVRRAELLELYNNYVKNL